MDKPQNIYLPTLYAGHSAVISWDAVIGAEWYSLERQINNESFVEVEVSNVTSLKDIVPINAITATYRIRAFNIHGLTWDELESRNRDWSAWDAIGWSWFYEYSEFTTSKITPVTLAKPANIAIPTLYAGHPATITWSSVLGSHGYSLERKLNIDSDFVEIYSTSSTSYTDNLPLTATTAIYRVRAYTTSNQTWNELDALELTWDKSDALGRSWFLQYSEFTTSPLTSIMSVSISVPTLHAGYIAAITWTKIPDATNYTLDRQIDSSGTFIRIYSGTSNTFTDTIPEAAKSIIYRMQWTRAGFTSNYVISISFEVIQNRPPVLIVQDLGYETKYRGFNIVFSATDPDPGNTINLQVKLDNIIIFTMPNVQQGVNYTATITDAQVFSMAQGSVHTITITATDNKGATATYTFTFIAVEDLVTTAVFYVLRDGRPIANIRNAREWIDYLEVGTHRYRIRGVDRYGNFSDSNEVTITIALKHAVLGLASNPGDFVGLIWRLDGKPTMGQNYDTNFSETWYEGRTFPVYENSGQKSNTIPLSFSTLNLSDQQNLLGLISRGEPLIYRDQYDSRVIGVIPNFASEFQGRYRTATHNALINFNLTLNRADFNEVIDYD